MHQSSCSLVPQATTTTTATATSTTAMTIYSTINFHSSFLLVCVCLCASFTLFRPSRARAVDCRALLWSAYEPRSTLVSSVVSSNCLPTAAAAANSIASSHLYSFANTRESALSSSSSSLSLQSIYTNTRS